MAYTFGDLQAALQLILWPGGEQENLVVAHRQMMVEALVELQTWVDCLKVNNTQVAAQCNTLFKCGYTVMDAPRGNIKRLYTLDRINQTTGLEDPTVPVDFCSTVNYRQVNFADLDRFVSQSLRGATGFDWGWCGIPDFLLNQIAFPACWQNKYSSYPPPTDAGLGNAPPLPIGFHYGQPSTDDPHGRRAQWGMWAMQGGQIFIAPWIQSTELIVIEYDGIKRTWADLDLVDPDPFLQRAVEFYVRWQQAWKYDHDDNAANAAVTGWNEARAVLIHQCREENEVRDSADAINSPARGAALVTEIFTNTDQTATAQCPQNTTGNPVTYTVPAGTVQSNVSVADANSKAKSLALQTASVQVICKPIAVVYSNSAQSFTATCAAGLGQPVTVNISSGQFTSTVSQADADAQALASATTQAQSGLSCSFVNAVQSYTAVCPVGQTGSNVTKTVAPGVFTSTVSQADADAKALASATQLANAALVCNGVTPTIYLNTIVSVEQTLFCATSRGGQVIVQLEVVQAGQFSSTVSQDDANQRAHDYAVALANSVLNQRCQQLRDQTGPPKLPPLFG